jgi:hypothetical protein
MTRNDSFAFFVPQHARLENRYFPLLWTVELAGRNLPDGLRVHYKCICPSMSEG